MSDNEGNFKLFAVTYWTAKTDGNVLVGLIFEFVKWIWSWAQIIFPRGFAEQGVSIGVILLG